MEGSVATSVWPRRALAFLILLGLFFTIRGYRSREGDQAYRLPLLLHRQDARLFADDPFVRAFDQFNPHRGYLALIDGLSRPFGLSTALALLYILTFFLTCFALDQLARVVWSQRGSGVGLIAVCLVLIAQAGNIGTNHLFEPILLDRLLASAFGWLAIALAVRSPRSGVWLSPLALGLSALVHPSLGLQLTILLTGTWLIWLATRRLVGLKFWVAIGALPIFAISALPGLLLNLQHSSLILDGLSPRTVRLLSAELQSPQHMLPHLWRFPQWLAWSCYPLLAGLAWLRERTMTRDTTPSPTARLLAILLITNLLGLGLAWVGIEGFENLRLTLFQPFRMATIARGLCLVFIAGHIQALWETREVLGRLRAVLIVVGLTGDWTLVIATGFEIVSIALDLGRARLQNANRLAWCVSQIACFPLLAVGFVFLSRHDTESGHVPMLVATLLTVGVGSRMGGIVWTPRRLTWALAGSWLVPLAALVANAIPEPSNINLRTVQQALIRRCRFAEVPLDDIERLAVWCRTRTPEGARFIGPPGPKTFRLWSLRAVAFNRAASPYQAAGLADWARRFADHVGFEGTPEALVAAYLHDRHGLERRYEALTPDEKASLALRQGAEFVVASAPGRGKHSRAEGNALTLLHVEGRYAVYQAHPDRVQSAQRTRERPL
ncbi:MAG: hypothetical protein NVSMB9_20500 [Isosphaeraceae bacterium]